MGKGSHTLGGSFLWLHRFASNNKQGVTAIAGKRHWMLRSAALPFRLLKALEASTRRTPRRTPSVEVASNRSCVAWTAASHPASCPSQSCNGPSLFKTSKPTTDKTAFPIIRLTTSHMPIDHFTRNGASGALLTALLRSSPYWAMAKRAFFLLVLETITFLSAFKSGLDELDTCMDVYWRSGHSDRFLLQIWCPERPFSRGYWWMCVSGLIVIDFSGAVALVLLEFCV